MTALYLIVLTAITCTYGFAELFQYVLEARRAWRRETDTWHGSGLVDETGERPATYEPLPTKPIVFRTQPVAGMTWLTTGYLESRLSIPWPVIRDRLRRERALLTPTQEQVFVELVEATWPSAEWCDSCRVGRDGEKPHVSCPGCPCPCGMPAEVAA
jgi:hypothetical protein